jgi:hypothetical protein
MSRLTRRRRWFFRVSAALALLSIVLSTVGLIHAAHVFGQGVKTCLTRLAATTPYEFARAQEQREALAYSRGFADGRAGRKAERSRN